MMFASLRQTFTQFFHAKKRPCRSRPRPRLQLLLEKLEDRTVPATFHVGPTRTITSINAAVGLASAGDTIKVDPGIYAEHVVVPSTKPGLEIEGPQDDHDPCPKDGHPYPRTPAGPSEATVTMGFELHANKVEVSGFTIENTNPFTTNGDGIFTDPTHSGYEIEYNIITKCANYGVDLYSNGIYKTQVEENWFDDLPSAPAPNFSGDIHSSALFNPFGPYGPLSNAEIEENCFDGHAPYSYASIWIEGGFTTFDTKIEISENKLTNADPIWLGNLTNTEVTDNKFKNWSGDAAIETIDAEYFHGVEIEDNSLSTDSSTYFTYFGIFILDSAGVGGPKADIVVEDNYLSDANPASTVYGIEVYQYDALNYTGNFSFNFPLGTPAAVTSIQDNEIKGFSRGINLYYVTGDTVADNEISHCYVGIELESHVTATVVKENEVKYCGDCGIEIEGVSTGNTIRENTTKNNADDGIFVETGSTGNTLTKNKSSGNGNHNYEDDNAFGVNTWTNNSGGPVFYGPPTPED